MPEKSDQSATSLWSRSKRSLGANRLTFLQHTPSMSKDDNTPPSDKTESPKTAHARRREQVRKAQRKHRERKETYIKSLENQVLRLLNQESDFAEEKKTLVTENTMLRDLLRHHDISIPSDIAGFGPAASVSMRDAPGGTHMLQVVMPESSPEALAQFSSSASESFDADQQLQLDPMEQSAHQPFLYSSPPPAQPPAFPTRLPSQSVEIHPAGSPSDTPAAKALPPLPAGSPYPPRPHPRGLDAPQFGIDFVLALEGPCLDHARSDLESDSSYGHSLTLQAPLITHAPRPICSSSSWTVPAGEVERLLNLSSQLNLAGEITPVQAWSRIRSHPAFDKLDLSHLQYLREALLKEVQCYGFGGVLDESAFSTILQQCVYGL